MGLGGCMGPAVPCPRPRAGGKWAGSQRPTPQTSARARGSAAGRPCPAQGGDCSCVRKPHGRASQQGGPSVEPFPGTAPVLSSSPELCSRSRAQTRHRGRAQACSPGGAVGRHCPHRLAGRGASAGNSRPHPPFPEGTRMHEPDTLCWSWLAPVLSPSLVPRAPWHHSWCQPASASGNL